MLKEFQEFALKGNMFDMAVGIILGAAFGTIVSSLVADIFTPLIGLFTGGVDFSSLFINLTDQQVASVEQAKEAGIATINYGVFINNVISFLIVAFVLFLMVKAYYQAKAQMIAEEEAAPVEPPRQEVLLEEIRDLLKRNP